MLFYFIRPAFLCILLLVSLLCDYLPCLDCVFPCVCECCVPLCPCRSILCRHTASLLCFPLCASNYTPYICLGLVCFCFCDSPFLLTLSCSSTFRVCIWILFWTPSHNRLRLLSYLTCFESPNEPVNTFCLVRTEINLGLLQYKPETVLLLMVQMCQSQDPVCDICVLLWLGRGSHSDGDCLLVSCISATAVCLNLTVSKFLCLCS